MGGKTILARGVITQQVFREVISRREQRSEREIPTANYLLPLPSPPLRRSLYDKTLPKIPSTCRRIKDLTESEKNQLIALFECFDTSKEGTLGSNEIKDGLTTFGKSPSNKPVQRILKQMHLSQAPANRVEFKGFALGIISRRSLLYDFLYDG